jgi:hypothetical protein
MNRGFSELCWPGAQISNPCVNLSRGIIRIGDPRARTD